MLIFSTKAYQKIKYFVQNVEGEISGLGQSIFLDNNIIVKDIIILEQTISGTSTNLEESAMASFLNEKLKNGENVASWNIWWHSHNNFDPFWSSIDEDTIQNCTGGQYLISIVINKEMKALARIDIFNPFKLSTDLLIIRPRGRPKETKKYLKTDYNRQIKKCIKQIDFKDKWKFLTPWEIKKSSLLSEEEILDQQLPMGWQS